MVAWLLWGRNTAITRPRPGRIMAMRGPITTLVPSSWCLVGDTIAHITKATTTVVVTAVAEARVMVAMAAVDVAATAATKAA